MIFKEIEWTSESGFFSNTYVKYDWEEIPQEELYEDGELGQAEVQDKIIHHVLDEGDWIVVRRINK
tara:strand:+ start:140 stop:337 length:198 start_codon:yes stop_codon:yes gene_type:complete